ncbi:MAG: hypothetical protein M1829_000375 [Trizodia sp. TS-e1964]|nr:MAG: hypothetical protein M1829_000375 [Trizodia sp. TS-e1964]
MASPTRATESETPLPTTETEVKTEEDSLVSDEEYQAMNTVLLNIYAHREPDGHDPSKIFHRKVNKRLVPDYYDFISEPMAMSTIKASINNRAYKNFQQFVRDFALISHNAQIYNLPEAGAYQDALLIKSVLESELKKLVKQNIIPAEAAALPDLGEIPAPSPRPNEEEADDDEDEEDDEEDEAEDSDEEGVRLKKKRGPRTGARRDDGKATNDSEIRKKRGRPPRVDTPMEARIKAVIKGLRKFRDVTGDQKVRHFERLPDKGIMPEYFAEIKSPMAFDVIKRKAKRKKYQSVDHFMRDVETIFDNARKYNEDESQIHQDAIMLQKEARVLAEQEKKKPDTDYMMEDGRLPLPNGILHNGTLWKVGDWVHIQNPNDLTKPIVAQIYRTWQDGDGQEWINACWYYRPEQTVHRVDRHFFEHEVVKTGQYRDHHIDEVVDKCWVMFFTRFNKGRPRGFSHDKEVYVCESRYNEEKHKLNKIKTWASCVPDEVREKDYEMDLFEHPRKMKKVPSPIKHLLPSDAKETDDIPKPTWGAENAPPVVGAVHMRPREPNESPPPEPTPSPPPPPPPPPQLSRRVSHVANESPSQTLSASAGPDVAMGRPTPQQMPHSAIPPPTTHQQTNFVQQYTSQFIQHSASPMPVYQTPMTPAAASTYIHTTPHSNFTNMQQASHVSQYSTLQPNHYHSSLSRGANIGANPYIPPRQTEVFRLPDVANSAIPIDIRERFQRDDLGHVLFFTSPPLDVLPTVRQGQAAKLGATLAEARKARLQRLGKLEARNLKRNSPKDDKEAKSRKKLVIDKFPLAEANEKPHDNLQEMALRMFGEYINSGNEVHFKALYGLEGWEKGKRLEEEKVARLQAQHQSKMKRIEEARRENMARRQVGNSTSKLYLDDIDPRY